VRQRPNLIAMDLLANADDENYKEIKVDLSCKKEEYIKKEPMEEKSKSSMVRSDFSEEKLAAKKPHLLNAERQSVVTVVKKRIFSTEDLAIDDESVEERKLDLQKKKRLRDMEIMKQLLIDRKQLKDAGVQQEEIDAFFPLPKKYFEDI
jgi:hypothetical protein